MNDYFNTIKNKLPENWDVDITKLMNAANETVFFYSIDSRELFVFGLKNKVFNMNEKVENLATDGRLLKLIDKPVLEEFIVNIKKLTEKEPVYIQNCELRLSGEPRTYKIFIVAVFNNGKMTGVIGKSVDIDDEIKQMKFLNWHANHDSLTGLYRTHFAKQKIKEKLADPNKNVILGIFDIDYFKGINDRYGHVFGDEVLKLVGKIALENIRTDGTDIVARIGGDEFLLCMEFKDKFDAAVKRLQSALICELDGVDISVSMGIADTRTVGRSYDDLYKFADQSLYASKRFGRGICSVYSPSGNGEYIIQKKK